VIPIELAVTNYEISLFIHICAAIIGLGVAFAESLLYPVALMLGPQHFAFKHRLQFIANTTIVLPALVVLLATGIYQAEEIGFELGKFWLTGAMAVVGVLALMLLVYFIPEDRRLERLVQGELAAAADGEVQVSAEYTRRVKIQALMGVIADLLVIAAVWLMVTKPGL
jgi:uncharacterized membrane protein